MDFSFLFSAFKWLTAVLRFEIIRIVFLKKIIMTEIEHLNAVKLNGNKSMLALSVGIFKWS